MNRKDEVQRRIAVERVAELIHVVRGQRIMLDIDLARLYEVPVRRLKEQVRRNRARFPNDFILELSLEETEQMLRSRSQNATLKRGWNAKYGAYAFTEQGVGMLSGVLNSPRAIEVNVAIMRAFVRMRELLSVNRDLARKLEEFEQKLITHDVQIEEVVEAIRGLMSPLHKPLRRIGYKP